MAGVTVKPVLVVVDSQCREQLKASAHVLLQYAAGASAAKSVQFIETSDTDGPVSREAYEEEMDSMVNDALANRNTRSQTIDRIPSKVIILD